MGFNCTAQKCALERYQALLQHAYELLISGSDDHTLFLWSLFPSPVNANTNKYPPDPPKRPPTPNILRPILTIWSMGRLYLVRWEH